MAHKTVNETDTSSDEEELFSYLEKVHEVKETEEVGCTKINKDLEDNNSHDTEGDKNAEKNNEAELQSCGSPKKTSFGTAMIRLLKKEEMLRDKKKVERHKCEEYRCVSLDDKERDDKKVEGSNHSGNAPSGDYRKEEEVNGLKDVADNHDASEQKVIAQTSKNQLPVHKTVCLNEEASNSDIILEQNSEKGIHSKQIDDSDCIPSVDYKQKPDSTSTSTDKYYLINEKDWLTLCDKLSNKVDSTGAAHPLIQESKTSPLKGQIFVPEKYEGISYAYKQNKSESFSLNKDNLIQLPNKSDHHGKMESLNEKAETLIQGTSSNTQELATHYSEGDQISKCSPQKMTSKTSPGTPKVEIVYITLDEEQTLSCKGEAIKNLDFSENMKHADISMRLNEKILVNEETPRVTRERQNFSQHTITKSDLPGVIKDSDFHEHEPFVPSYIPESKSSINTVSNQGKRVRFVRINDKLTRVYEDVVEEAVDLYNADDSDITGEAELFNKEQSDVQEGYNVDEGYIVEESFNFNDSQLIAFPINAVDVENMIKDDSMAMLTPSKLDMLTPSKLDMLTPSKLEILTPSKLSVLDDENDKSVDKSFTSPIPNTAMLLNTTSLSDGKFENESTIVLNVTRSGELVECRSNESSLNKKVAEPESPMTDTERRSRNRNSHIRKLWKDVKQQQNLKKRSKQISAIPMFEGTDTETKEIKSSDKELSSDEDELKLYFSHNLYSKNRAITGEHIAQTNNASDKQTCSISIQASFTESSYESAGEEIPKEKENNNLESCLRNYSKQSRKDVLEIKRGHNAGRNSNAESRCVANPSLKDTNTNLKQKVVKIRKVEREGTTSDKMTATKICVDSFPSKQSRKRNKTKKGSCLTIWEKGTEKSDNVFSVEENFPKKKKGNTQIRNFFKDIDYKQVDFEDLEDTIITQALVTTAGKKQMPRRKSTKRNNSKKESTAGKNNNIKINKESSKEFGRDELEEVRECKKKQNSFNSGNDKESVKEQNRSKSRKVKTFEKEQNTSKSVPSIEKRAAKVGQIKQETEKKMFLKKAMNTKETEIKTVDRVETANISTDTALRKDDIDSNMFNEEGQNKIEFLEKLFHIKLKEATSNRNISAICKNKTQKAFIDTITEENKDRINMQCPRGKRSESDAKSNAKQPLKLPKARACKRMKDVNVADLPREVARDSLNANSENIEVYDNNVTVKEKSVTVNEKHKRKNIRPVSHEVSKNKKPKKCELEDSGVSPENSVVSIQGKENLVEKDLEEVPEKKCSGSRHKSEEGKVLDMKRKGGKPRNCKAKCDLLTHKDGCSEEVKVMNDTPSHVKTVHKKKSVAERKGPKKNDLDFVIDELKKETIEISSGTSDSSVEKESMNIKRTKLVKGIRKKAPKIISHNNDIKQNVTSSDSLKNLNDNLVQMSKDSVRNTKAKKSVESKQGKAKLAKDRVKENSYNSAGLNDNLHTEHGVKPDKSETFCEICGCSVSTVSKLSKRKGRNIKYEITDKSDIQNICKQCSENRELIEIKETSLEEKNNNLDIISEGPNLLKGEQKCKKLEDIDSQDVFTSNVAKFEPLHQHEKKSMKTESRKRKKLEADSVLKNVSKKKKSEVHENKNAPANDERKNGPGYDSHIENSKINVKEYQQDDETLAVNSEDIPLDLSLPKVKDHNMTDESVDKNQQQKSLSLPRKLRRGKELKHCSSRKGNSPKNLKSVRKPPSTEKLKSKRLEKEVWKEKLEDGAFKFDFDERKDEIHKPVNVRRMIIDILESVKGMDVKKGKKSNHRKCKDKIKKWKGNNDTEVRKRVTSESEDAWLSDSGPSSSFPAFKFSETCDSAGKSEFHMVDTNLDNKEVETLNRNENVETGVKENGRVSDLAESPFDKLKTACDKETIELHNSPQKVFHKLNSKGENSKSLGNSKDLGKSVKFVEHSEDSPEVRKNVDKLRALLNKVNEKKVVKHLKFADTVASSDSEY